MLLLTFLNFGPTFKHCILDFFTQAALVVADKNLSLQITGNGDVLEPHDGIIAIGSGSPYALAAARALIDVPGMDARTIAQKAMSIAADACIYTNTNFTALHIDKDGKIEDLEVTALETPGKIN